MVTKASFYVPISRGPKGHHCWYLKTHFLELLQLKSSLKYFRKYSSEINFRRVLSKILQLNIRQHSPITHAHSMTCRQTSFSMQSVPDPKVYFPGTSTPEGPQHTGPAPWGRMFHPFTLLHPRHLHHQHQHPQNP